MLEKNIERRLVNGVKDLGGLCLKFTSPSSAGVPDRLIILPKGRVVFAEVKAEGGKLSKMQAYMIEELRRRGADVRVMYGLSDVKVFLSELEEEPKKNEI